MMKTASRPTPSDVARFQSLRRLRWSLLLGHPALDAIVEPVLRSFAGDPESLRAMTRKTTAVGAGSRGAGGRARGAALHPERSELVDRLARRDRFGRAASARCEAGELEALAAEDPGVKAHADELRRVHRMYREVRDRLVITHLGLVRLAVNRLSVAVERRRTERPRPTTRGSR